MPGQRTLIGDDLRVAMPSMGARRGEPCALRWSDVDFGERTVLIARSLVEGRVPELTEKDIKTHASRRIALDRGREASSSAIEIAAATAPLRAVCR